MAGAAGDQGERSRPGRALLLRLDRQQWQALAAACAAPAFYGPEGSMPLILDDGSEKRDVAIPHDTASVKDFGNDAASATARIARKYWKKAPAVFVVGAYEQALWVIPSAALLSAPILVNPDASTLQALGATRAIVVGSARPAVRSVRYLASKAAVWKFQLSLMAERGERCTYVVMTNPHDTDDRPSPNVQWPYLSLAAAPLAAYRRALVQTGDYTANRKLVHALGVSLGDNADKVKYQALKPSIKKVKDDSYAAARFLADNGHTPQFLAMVGGSVELPHYVIDLHTKYTYWNQAIDYVPADTPYATMRTDLDYTRFVKPDLAVGRIMADSVQDATVMLARTFFRKEFRQGGKYAALAPKGWEKTAAVLDGHRLNQPDEGGPDASPHLPFHPAGEVQAVFTKSGLKSDYLYPSDETKKTDQRTKAPELFASTSAYGFVQYVAHGDPPHMRIEAGKSGRDVKNYLATGPEFRKRLNFQAPTVAYVIGCNVGCVCAPFTSNDQFLPTAAVHAGTVAFLAPNKCQSICFWRYAPRGAGASQCIYFWQNALGKGMPLGKALNDAKWRAYLEWCHKQSETNRGKDTDNSIEIDPPSMVLFGDPALRLTD